MPLSTNLQTFDGPSCGKPLNPFSDSAPKEEFVKQTNSSLAQGPAPSHSNSSDSEDSSDQSSSSDSEKCSVAGGTAPAGDGQRAQTELEHKGDTSCASASKCLNKAVYAKEDANRSIYGNNNSSNSNSNSNSNGNSNSNCGNRRHSSNGDTNNHHNHNRNHNSYGDYTVGKGSKLGKHHSSSRHAQQNQQGHKGSSSDAHNKKRSCTRSASVQRQRTRVTKHVAQRRDVPCRYGRQCQRYDCWFQHPDGREVDDEAPSTKKKGLCRKPESGKMTRGRSMKLSLRRTRQLSSRRNGHENPRPSARFRSRTQKQHRRARRHESTDDEATQSELKLASFREFVIRNMDLWTSPDDALSEYDKYKLEFAKRSETSIRQSWLLFDLYNITSQLRWYDLKVCLCKRKAEKFAHDLHQKRYKDLSLSVRTLCSTNRKVSATCPTFGHLKPPCFAFDPNTHGICVAGIPLEVSTWSIIDLLQACPGFASIHMSKPLPGNGLREMRLRFDSADSAKSALAILGEAQLQGCHQLKASLTVEAPSLDAFVLPSEMSTSEQIYKDERQSAETLRKLDRIMGIPAWLTQAVLSYTGSSEANLDLHVLYLRSVHNFCFYSSAWCDDEWDLRDRCGPALVRDNANELQESSQHSTWTAMHNTRIEEFTASANLERPQGLGGGQVEIRSRYDAVCAEKTHQLGEGKFQCLLCGRKFRGSDFVQKHISRMHADVFESILRAAWEEAAFDEYLADPDRPVVFSC